MTPTRPTRVELRDKRARRAIHDLRRAWADRDTAPAGSPIGIVAAAWLRRAQGYAEHEVREALATAAEREAAHALPDDVEPPDLSPDELRHRPAPSRELDALRHAWLDSINADAANARLARLRRAGDATRRRTGT